MPAPEGIRNSSAAATAHEAEPRTGTGQRDGLDGTTRARYAQDGYSHLMSSQRRRDPLGCLLTHAPEVTGCLLKVRLDDLTHHAFHKLRVLLGYLYHGQTCYQCFCGPVSVTRCNVNSSETSGWRQQSRPSGTAEKAIITASVQKIGKRQNLGQICRTQWSFLSLERSVSRGSSAHIFNSSHADEEEGRRGIPSETSPAKCSHAFMAASMARDRSTLATLMTAAQDCEAGVLHTVWCVSCIYVLNSIE